MQSCRIPKNVRWKCIFSYLFEGNWKILLDIFYLEESEMFMLILILYWVNSYEKGYGFLWDGNHINHVKNLLYTQY